MPQLLDQLTLSWFWRAAMIGVILGYAGRVFDHAVWASGRNTGQTAGDVVRFAAMIIPLCATCGFVLGYALTVTTAYVVRNSTVVEAASYGAPALMAFFATELRELLRRLWQRSAG